MRSGYCLMNKTIARPQNIYWFAIVVGSYVIPNSNIDIIKEHQLARNHYLYKVSALPTSQLVQHGVWNRPQCHWSGRRLWLP